MEDTARIQEFDSRRSLNSAKRGRGLGTRKTRKVVPQSALLVIFDTPPACFLRGTHIVTAFSRSLWFPTFRLPASATGGGRLQSHRRRQAPVPQAGFRAAALTFPYREAIKEKSSQGAKRTLTVDFCKAAEKRSTSIQVATKSPVGATLRRAYYALHSGNDGFKPLFPGRNCRLRLLSGLSFFYFALGDDGGLTPIPLPEGFLPSDSHLRFARFKKLISSQRKTPA